MWELNVLFSSELSTNLIHQANKTALWLKDFSIGNYFHCVRTFDKFKYPFKASTLKIKRKKKPSPSMRHIQRLTFVSNNKGFQTLKHWKMADPGVSGCQTALQAQGTASHIRLPFLLSYHFPVKVSVLARHLRRMGSDSGCLFVLCPIGSRVLFLFSSYLLLEYK